MERSSPLPQQYDVRTARASVAQLTFPDGSVARVAPESTLRVHTYPRSTAEARTDLQLFGGEVWNTVVKIPGHPSEYGVRTDDALALVRGTSFDVSDSKTGTRVVCQEHEVQVRSGERRVTVGDGRGVLASRSGFSDVRVRELEDDAWFTDNERADLDYYDELQEDEDLDAYYGEDVDDDLEQSEADYREDAGEVLDEAPDFEDPTIDDTGEWETWADEAIDDVVDVPLDDPGDWSEPEAIDPAYEEPEPDPVPALDPEPDTEPPPEPDPAPEPDPDPAPEPDPGA